MFHATQVQFVILGLLLNKRVPLPRVRSNSKTTKSNSKITRSSRIKSKRNLKSRQLKRMIWIFSVKLMRMIRLQLNRLRKRLTKERKSRRLLLLLNH